MRRLPRLDIDSPANTTGVLSEAVGDLKALTTLHMDYHEGNRLSGTLPATIGQCEHLEELIVNGHGLTGTIPESLKRLKSLRLIHLDENRFTGTIPVFFAQLQGLEELHLAKNQLSGTVPDGIDLLKTLHALDLNGNPKLEGSVPELGPGVKEEADRLVSTENENDSDFVNEMASSVDAASWQDGDPVGHDGGEL